MLSHLPNALTLSRLILSPFVAWAVWRSYDTGDAGAAHALAAAGLFLAAALSDLFDGMAARAFHSESKFGRVLDPIADKALVGLPLLALSLVALREEWPAAMAIAVPATVIVARDMGVTLLRLAAPDGEGVRVSQLAKWKTAVELVTVGAPILALPLPRLAASAGLGDLTPLAPGAFTAWLILLALAAALSAYTGLQYLAKPRA